MPCCQKRKRLKIKKDNTKKYSYAQRIEICKSCEHSYTSLKRVRCKVCKCFMEIKARIPYLSCPKDKW